jgi:hypothetical protein
MRILVAPVVVLVACSSSNGAPSRGDGSPPQPKASAFQRCMGRTYTPAPDEKWRRNRTSLSVQAGEANHAGKDVVAAPGAPGTLTAKFSYGKIGKDLEEEDVMIFLDDCTGWKALGRRRTDDDGRISIQAPDLPAGVYEVRFQVAGDRSLAASSLWVLPKGTRVIVTDIDATLTTSDAALWTQLREGKLRETTYPTAVELMRAHEEKGHVIVYMTGRPYWLQAHTRNYLAALSFPPGVLRVTDSNTDILPTEDSVGAYKLSNLKSLLGAGLAIDFAYGNATTDIFAYLGAGIPADRSWIIGKHGGAKGTKGIAADWGARVTEVKALPTVAQPFAR